MTAKIILSGGWSCDLAAIPDDQYFVGLTSLCAGIPRLMIKDEKMDGGIAVVSLVHQTDCSEIILEALSSKDALKAWALVPPLKYQAQPATVVAYEEF